MFDLYGTLKAIAGEAGVPFSYRVGQNLRKCKSFLFIINEISLGFFNGLRLNYPVTKTIS